MRVIARSTASIAKRAARSSSLSAPRVCATAILAGVVAGCGVTLPTPPTGHNRRRTAMRPRVPVAARGVRKWRWEPARPGARATRDAGLEHRQPETRVRRRARHLLREPVPEAGRRSVARGRRMSSLSAREHTRARLRSVLGSSPWSARCGTPSSRRRRASVRRLAACPTLGTSATRRLYERRKP
jgi:hypothetical protein